MSQRIPAKEFEKQYKDHLSGFHEWNQKEHAEEWLLFPENIGSKLSIDETSLSNGELYTIITNKRAKGKKGAIVVIVKGIKATDISAILNKIPIRQRRQVKEVTLDMSNSMDAIVRTSFSNAIIVTDRFHVQQLVSGAVQEVRMIHRRKAIKEENEAIKKIKEENTKCPRGKNNKSRKYYEPEKYENKDTKKQLLARSRYLLFKPESKWTEGQKIRSEILFREFPDLKKAYNLSMNFRSIYEHGNSIKNAKEKLKKWYVKIENKNIKSFLLPRETISLHETNILNYFINRSTNASAESFNAKLKGFRALVRGVRDKKFFLFRIAKLYA